MYLCFFHTEWRLAGGGHFLREAYEAKKLSGIFRWKDTDDIYPWNDAPLFVRQGCQWWKTLLHDRYEFLVFRLLRNQLEAGDIFCRQSIRFRSLEDDLLSDEQWQQKDALIANTSLSILKLPIEIHLQSLETELEELLVRVNDRIQKGENDYVTIKEQGKKRSWSLSYGTPKEPINHAFFDFYHWPISKRYFILPIFAPVLGMLLSIFYIGMPVGKLIFKPSLPVW